MGRITIYKRTWFSLVYEWHVIIFILIIRQRMFHISGSLCNGALCNQISESDNIPTNKANSVSQIAKFMLVPWALLSGYLSSKKEALCYAFQFHYRHLRVSNWMVGVIELNYVYWGPRQMLGTFNECWTKWNYRMVEIIWYCRWIVSRGIKWPEYLHIMTI